MSIYTTSELLGRARVAAINCISGMRSIADQCHVVFGGSRSVASGPTV